MFHTLRHWNRANTDIRASLHSNQHLFDMMAHTLYLEKKSIFCSIFYWPRKEPSTSKILENLIRDSVHLRGTQQQNPEQKEKILIHNSKFYSKIANTLKALAKKYLNFIFEFFVEGSNLLQMCQRSKCHILAWFRNSIWFLNHFHCLEYS